MPVCPACQRKVSLAGRFCTACGAQLTTEPAGPTAVFAPGAETAPGAPLEGPLHPGQVLAGRYRIVALLGRGGMGEVYRADDLMLGQSVALKFLPRQVARDPSSRARFHQEVRLARQVGHPNVCRVYDLGEADGLLFLTMEYIDGQDLAGVLRQVGRLPEERGVEIARQIGMALAAVHEQGLLHRDLKPHNVMIDGRGRVRLTDFGLAALAGSVADVRSGTPAYQAPEQLEGRAATIRSDLFALGLVLYELFTGKRAYEAPTREELLLRHAEGSVSKPSSHVGGLHPAIERVILRCLDPDPAQRPASAYEVVAALPGSDPLAEALAAGQTPSPKLVAEAGGRGGLSPALAWVCLVAVLLGVGLVVALAGPGNLIGRCRPEERPEALDRRARDVLRELGQPAGAYSAAGFAYDHDYLAYCEQHDPSPARWATLARSRPPALVFWYRQAPQPLQPGRLFSSHSGGTNRTELGAATLDDPPALDAGTATVKLAPDGRLLQFQAIPPQQAARPSGPADWESPFRLAGLPRERFVPRDEPLWDAPVPADEQRSWTAPGLLEDWPDAEVVVQAAAHRGRLVYFEVLGPWSRPERDRDEAGLTGEQSSRRIEVGLKILLLLAGAGLAAYNLSRGRGDRAGAARLVAAVFVVLSAAWVLTAHHTATLGEWDLLMAGLALALVLAAEFGLYYLAIEPFVRRLWPQGLISWSRLLAGRLSDPLIGRDVLLGTLGGVVGCLLFQLALVVPGWVGLPAPLPETNSPTPLLGARFALGRLLLDVYLGLANALIFDLLLFLVLRVALGRTDLAVAGYVVLSVVVWGVWVEYRPLPAAFMVAAAGLSISVLLRGGLLAITVYEVVLQVLYFAPLVPDQTAWYAGGGLFHLLGVVALVVYGFRTALAGRPLFGGRWLEA